eukprot:scaffold5929_cov81-Cylindrotheca_fusiformis.AAC.2
MEEKKPPQNPPQTGNDGQKQSRGPREPDACNAKRSGTESDRRPRKGKSEGETTLQEDRETRARCADPKGG